MFRHSFARVGSIRAANVINHLKRGDYAKASDLLDATFDANSESIIALCEHNVLDALQIVTGMIRGGTVLGRADPITRIFFTAVRDFPVHQGELLTVDFFNMYLDVLSRKKRLCVDEVRHVLSIMKERGIALNATTYLHLAEMHARAASPQFPALLDEMETKQIPFLEGTVACFLFHVAAHFLPSASLSAANAATGGGQNISESSPSATTSPSPEQPSSSGTQVVPSSSGTQVDVRFVTKVLQKALPLGIVPRTLLSAIIRRWVQSPHVPPESALWLIFELEHMCVFHRVALTQHLQKQDFVHLLARCAKIGDTETGERVVATMDRHLLSKAADVLGLLVMCYAHAGELEKSLSTVETLAKKGVLEYVDGFRKFSVDTIGIVFDKHYLMAVVDSMSTSNLVDRGFMYLEQRKQQGLPVTVHALDLIIHACSKIADENRATQTLESYERDFGVSPRTHSYNCLLLGTAGKHHSTWYNSVFESMLKRGVQPNNTTFRILIRQCVAHDNIDEAIQLLEKVQTVPGVRIEIEMILPIMERAARAGDLETTLRIARYALEWEIGIDSSVLNMAIGTLTAMGEDVTELKTMVPLHEKLRQKPRWTRTRIPHEVPV